MILMGSALVGLGLLGRRRKKRCTILNPIPIRRDYRLRTSVLRRKSACGLHDVQARRLVRERLRNRR